MEISALCFSKICCPPTTSLDVSTIQALTKRAKYQKRLLDQFTNCIWWRKEYLLGVRETSKAPRRPGKETPVAVGDMIMLRNESVFILIWSQLLINPGSVMNDYKVRLQFPFSETLRPKILSSPRINYSRMLLLQRA